MVLEDPGPPCCSLLCTPLGCNHHIPLQNIRCMGFGTPYCQLLLLITRVSYNATLCELICNFTEWQSPCQDVLQSHHLVSPLFPSSPLNFPTAPLMDLLLSTLTGAPIILLACQPTAQRPMLVQTKLGPAGYQPRRHRRETDACSVRA